MHTNQSVIEEQILSYAVEKTKGFTIQDFISDSGNRVPIGKVMISMLELCDYDLLYQKNVNGMTCYFPSENGKRYNTAPARETVTEAVTEAVTEDVIENHKVEETTLEELGIQETKEETPNKEVRTVRRRKKESNAYAIYRTITESDKPLFNSEISKKLGLVNKNAAALLSALVKKEEKIDRAKKYNHDTKTYSFCYYNKDNPTHIAALNEIPGKIHKDKVYMIKDATLVRNFITEAKEPVALSDIIEALKDEVNIESLTSTLTSIYRSKHMNIGRVRKKSKNSNRTVYHYFFEGGENTKEPIEEETFTEVTEVTVTPTKNPVVEEVVEEDVKISDVDVSQLYKEVVQLRERVAEQKRQKFNVLLEEKNKLIAQLSELKSI